MITHEKGPASRNFQTVNQSDMIDLIKKYLKLLWRKKLLIIVITVVVTVIWVALSSIFLKKFKEYNAYALLQFDDPRANVNTVQDYGAMQMQGKISILFTKKFLMNVSDSLKLQIQFEDPLINRFELMTDLRIKNNFEEGSYKLVQELDNVLLSKIDQTDESIDQLLVKQEIGNQNNIRLETSSITMIINPNYLKIHNPITFNYVDERRTIDQIRKNIGSLLDQSGTILTITYKSTVPEEAMMIVNTIATMFIDQLLLYKTYRTSSILNFLSEQLTLAGEDLKKSENELRYFRERNPYLMLSRTGSSLVGQISGKESDLRNLTQNILRITDFIDQKSTAKDEETSLIYQEILSDLTEANIPEIPILNKRLESLLYEKNTLLRNNFSPEHPKIIEVDSKILSLFSEIDQVIYDYINSLEKNKLSLERALKNEESDLRRLPSDEIRLAELERNRSVKSNLYQNILVKYNESRISNASVIPDAILIEEAEVPLRYYDQFEKLKTLAIGPILGIILGIGLFLVVDYLDNTVRVVSDVEKNLQLPVLTQIPVIKDDHDIPDIILEKNRLDPKLITTDYSPSIAGERFRILRTKLLMNGNKKSYIIASYSPGDGKSLVAANLAVTFAQQKIATLLVDGDLRRGVLHSTFNCDKKPGLVDLLVTQNDITVDEISKCTQKTHVPNLYLMPKGNPIPNPSELLGTSRMENIVKVLEEKFGIIIWDTPPIEFIPDMLVLNRFIHNIVFVLRYGKTNLSKVSEKISEYHSIKSDFSGLVLNSCVDDHNNSHGYTYYQY